MANTYTVTVMATHLVRETYVIESELPYETLYEKLKEDPSHLYCGDWEAVGDEFVECLKLSLLDVEQTPAE